MSIKSSKTLNGGIRVLVVAQYPLVQDALEALVESSPDMTVVGTHTTGNAGAGLIEVVDSDVAIVDLSPDDRPEIIADLLRKTPTLRVVVVVEGNDLASQAVALNHGAVGIVRKSQSPRILLEAVRQTHKGETWLNQVLLARILERDTTQLKSAGRRKRNMDNDLLTPRELAVVMMIGEGLKNKDVGERLSISEATVRHHLSSIYGKIGVDDKLNLIIMAYKMGWVTLTDGNAEPVENGY